MTRQYARISSCFGAAALVVGAVVVSGCGSDAPTTTSASASSTNVSPSGKLASTGHVGRSGKAASKDEPPPPPRPQTKEDCDACYGLWGVHGIAQVESCICATIDAGQACTDGRECQGQCIVDREAGFQIMDPSDPPRGFFVGTCSEYDTTFGCFLLIPRGIEDLIPLPADAAAEDICVD